MSAASPSSTAGRRRALFRPLLIGVSLLVMVWVGLVAWHVLAARAALTSATENVDDLQDSLRSGSVDQAMSQLDDLSSELDSADGHLGGPSVTVARKIPFVGKNITAVRTITASLQSVADQGLPPVVTAASGLDQGTFSPSGGRVDVNAIAKLATPLATLNRSLAAADEDIAAIETGGLLGPVKTKVIDVKKKVDKAATLARRGSTAAQVLPEMLGADGPRQYLLIFQNNAEIRTAGGLPGAFAVIRTNDGKIDLGAQGSGGVDLGDLPTPVSKVSDVEKELFKGGVTTAFSDVMARDLRYTNYTPDFPRTGELAAAIVKRRLGVDVDGVVAIDPVTLGYILRATGPVTLADGTRIDSKNAVSVLLNKAYIDIPVPLQDAFFASAAEKIFQKVTSGAGDPADTMRELTRAANERRLLVWSNNPEIESVLTPTALSGALSQRTYADPRIGTYFNDAGSGKLEYYLRYSAAATSTACTDDGEQTYRETVKLTSTLPADFAKLPEYIIGNGDHVARGTMLLLAYIYAPVKGTIVGVQLDGKAVDWTPVVHEGRPVAKLTITLKPGQTTSITASIQSAIGQPGDTHLDVTPSVEAGSKNSIVTSSCN